MKVEELFKTIEPMVEQVDKGTALFMLGCDDEKECYQRKSRGHNQYAGDSNDQR